MFQFEQHGISIRSYIRIVCEWKSRRLVERRDRKLTQRRSDRRPSFFKNRPFKNNAIFAASKRTNVLTGTKKAFPNFIALSSLLTRFKAWSSSCLIVKRHLKHAFSCRSLPCQKYRFTLTVPMRSSINVYA